jgi:8-oxo-dGTP diphosphatase
MDRLRGFGVIPSAPATPRVGVGVIVIRDGLVLVGERLGAHGAGTWALPGGHLEFGETLLACAGRELFEETGLLLASVSPGPYANDLFEEERKHYVTLFVVAHDVTGTPEVREPGKCAQWKWVRWSELPDPLFPPLVTLCRQGYIPPGAA